MWTLLMTVATKSLLLCGAQTANRVFTMIADNQFSWNQAWEKCESVDARLITMDSDDVLYALEYFSTREFNAVWNQGGSTYWTGLHSCQPTPASFVWADDTPLGGYQPWISGGLGADACVAFSGTLQEGESWATESCANPAQVVCERVEGTCSFIKYIASTLVSNLVLDLLQSSISSAAECRQRCLDFPGPGQCGAVTFESLLVTSICKLHTDISLRDIESRRTISLPTSTLYVKFCFEADVTTLPVTADCIDNITDSMPWKACPNVSRATTGYLINPSCSIPVDEPAESTYLIPSSRTESTVASSFYETLLLSSDSSDWIPLDATSVHPGLLTSYGPGTFTSLYTSSHLPDISSLEEIGSATETIMTSWFFTTDKIDIIPTSATATISTYGLATSVLGLSFSDTHLASSKVGDLVQPLLTHLDLPLAPTKVLSIDSIPSLLCTCCKRKASVISNVSIEVVLQELSIDFKNTSSYQRKFISIYEDRASVVAMGYLGIAMMGAMFGVMLVSDAVIILKDLRTVPYPVVRQRKPGQSMPCPETTDTVLAETNI